jgi:outer membrane protein assembly factor BamB
MSKEKVIKTVQQKPLRLWPGVVAAIFLWVIWFGVKSIIPEMQGFLVGLAGGYLGIIAILVWWIFFSRAPHSERWGALGLMIVTSGLLWFIKHDSMGPLWMIYHFIPLLHITLVVWALVTQQRTRQFRLLAMVVMIVVLNGMWALVRMEGIDGDHVATFGWRWTRSSEEKVMIHPNKKSIPIEAHGLDMNTKPEWPGFRGSDRNGIILGVSIDTNWSASPPVVLWRQPIGAGWSSFAVHSNCIYTQEQRGDDEVVACYNAKNGAPLWYHKDKARFFESNGGAGPRGTPTLSNGRVYALGGTGIFNVLEASTGNTVWSRNVVKDTKAKVPVWGFSGSPLIIDDMVIVAASSSLIAYDINTGKPRWSKKYVKEGYSSPHLLTIHGVPQVVFLNERGIISVTATTGKILWEHAWPGNPIMQPSITSDGDIFISVSETSGIRCLSVTNGSNGWTAKERWTSKRLKPYFNDFVVHKGYIYGFHTRSIACIDVQEGKRIWKGGRYGNGQLILLADQDILLVISEKGEIALVNAHPDKFTELGKFPVIKGKTWNHPVLVKDMLYVRNDREMAACRLTLAGNE